MSEISNECVAPLKRQNAIVVPQEQIDFHDDDDNDGRYDFLDRILKEQELRDQERTRIQEMKENRNKK